MVSWKIFEKNDFNGDNYLYISQQQEEIVVFGKGGVYLSKKEVNNLIKKLKRCL